VMVMRASGGGNVIAYNYFDNGYIGDYLEWVETGINASHLTCPHFELFEGNQAFNIDGDDTFGGAMDITYFRNQATSHRRDFPDQDNRRAIGLMYYHYNYSFVGNVLGYAGMSPAPYPSFDYEDFFPWEQGGDFNAPVALWRIGYTPLDWNATPDPRVLSSIHRHANYDYVTNSVELKPGFDTTLPKSMYLTLKPWFMADSPWPWIDAQGTTKVNTLPARARFDAGQPVDLDLIFADNFQSSDLSAWGASATGAGKLTVSSQAGMASTTLGLRAAVSDSTPLYVEDDWPQDEDQFRARFYFNPSGFDPGEAQGHLRTRIFLVFEENPLRRLSAVVLKRQGGAFSLLQRCRLDDGSFADGTFVPITNAAHSIEISWKRSSTPTANDGACQMYVDNVLVSSRSGLDNNVSSVDFVRMGALSVKGGASGVLMWDQYWSRRKTLIGP
jgi:hypothetical protein